MSVVGHAARPCVLVVEDDPSMREFVAMALDEVDAQLLLAADVDDAMRVLQEGPAVDVVLTDLALGGRSALELLDRLAPPGQPPAATVIVFSGGVDAAGEATLLARGAWRVLRKPAPVAALEAVVRGALAERAAGAGPVAPGDDAPPRSTGAPAPSHPRAATAPTPGLPGVDEDALVATWFAGERALYQQFLVSCRPRLAAAVEEGDAAAQSRDGAALASLCHRLKTLLRMLGAEADARVAAAIETSLPVDRVGGLALWQALRRRLLAHAGAGAGTG